MQSLGDVKADPTRRRRYEIPSPVVQNQCVIEGVGVCVKVLPYAIVVQVESYDEHVMAWVRSERNVGPLEPEGHAL